MVEGHAKTPKDQMSAEKWKRRLGLVPERLVKGVDYEDIDLSGFSLPVKKQNSRRRISRYSRDISEYFSWRIFDRELTVGKINEGFVAKVYISPVDIIHAFGEPDPPRREPDTQGEWTFEDSNLDLFKVYEYR